MKAIKEFAIWFCIGFTTTALLIRLLNKLLTK